MRYARIVDGVIAELREFGVTPDPNPAKGLDWRSCPIVLAPPFDSATQVRSGPTYTVNLTEVVEEWSVRDKTAPELAADVENAKEGHLDAAVAFDAVFKALFNHENRIRTLAGQATITPAQFRAGIKALL